MRRLAAVLLAALAAPGCEGGVIGGGEADGEPGGGPVDAGAPDAVIPAQGGVAPPGVVVGEQPVADGANPIDLPPGGVALLRVEVEPGQHVAFDLRFDESEPDVVMAVSRWDGDAPVEIGLTDAGAGLRVLAVVDQSEPRTFWVRIDNSGAGLSGAVLTVTRTPFSEGIHCTADCARLLQLPLPNDPAVDGYSLEGAILRYQFGRRDLDMFLRYAGRAMSAAGMEPFVVGDLSQWDGATPGTDVGALRHVSHQRGKDVDITLYGSDGHAPWRSYCDAVNSGDGRECIPGSLTGFDGYAVARELAAYYESGRVTMCFMDRELIGAVIPGAEQAAADGVVAEALLPLYSDGHHLQHWPNHDNHVHVRVSEEEEGAPAAPPPFEAP